VDGAGFDDVHAAGRRPRSGVDRSNAVAVGHPRGSVRDRLRAGRVERGGLARSISDRYTIRGRDRRTALVRLARRHRRAHRMTVQAPALEQFDRVDSAAPPLPSMWSRITVPRVVAVLILLVIALFAIPAALN